MYHPTRPIPISCDKNPYTFLWWTLKGKDGFYRDGIFFVKMVFNPILVLEVPNFWIFQNPDGSNLKRNLVKNGVIGKYSMYLIFMELIPLESKAIFPKD